jgi:hypothetical protein
MNKFNLLISLMFLFNTSLFGQSVTISPSGPENLEIFKVGNALLSIKGKSQGTTEGTSSINLESNHGVVAGFIGTTTRSSTKGISAINFNSPTENKFSIKNEHYYTTSITSGDKNYSSLLVNNGLEEIARFENDFFSAKKIGINDQDPYFPLTFNNDFGDKISLNNRTCNNILGQCFSTNEHYGIGLQSNLFQIFTKDINGDIVFGYGKSSTMTERLRIKGNGKVGIGLISPNDILDINGRARIRHNINSAGIWMSNSTNSVSVADGAFYGMKTDTEAGIWIGNNWRFWVNNSGNVTVGGTVTASCGVLVCSDFRYKKNITPLNNSLNNLLAIQGVRYEFKKDEFLERNFSEKSQIGFIAQELEGIFPEMVFTDEKGYKSVDYAKLTPVLVEAMKEQQKMIEDLRKANVDLKNIHEKLESRLDKIESILNK